DALGGRLFPSEVRGGGTALARQVQRVVEPAAPPPPQRRAILGKTGQDHGGASRKAGRHDIPWLVAVIAGLAAIGAQQDGGDVREFGHHELDHRAAVQVGAVETEKRKIAGHERVKVEVSTRPCTPSTQLYEVLCDLAANAAVRFRVDRLCERRVSGEMLQRKQLPARIDRVALVLLRS